MKIHSIASTAVLVASSAVSATPAKKIHAADHPSLKKFAEKINSDSGLRRKVMEKAKPHGSGRRLQNNYQGNNYYAANNANVNKANDGADDYFAANGDWENDFGFDPTQYSLSYHRCAEVRQFDDQLAAQEDTDTVFATKHFVVFRFCPSKTCSGLEQEPEEYAAQAYQQANQQRAYGQQGTSSSYTFDFGATNAYTKMKEGGANGDGCQTNYGEYMMELQDYLQIMTEYQEERLETYCETCEECVYDVYKQWMKYGMNNGEWVETQKYGNRELKDRSDLSWMDDLKSFDFEEHRQLGGKFNPYKYCPEYDTCVSFKQVCDAGLDNTLSDYFECTQVQRNNGNIAYVGPRCAADGISITLGVFSDENCFEYIGNGLKIENVLGFELEDDALARYVTGSFADIIPGWTETFNPSEQMCIPCMSSRQPYEVRGNIAYYQSDEQRQQYGGQANYNQYQDEQHGEINELCESLYKVSARCDKNFRSYSSKTKQAKYAEAIVQEDLTCDFIDTIVMGNYDELGFINADLMKGYSPEAKDGVLANSIYVEQYGGAVHEVNGFQIFGLVASIAAFLSLAVYSMSLRGSLPKGPIWRPRKAAAMVTIDDEEKESPAKVALGRGRSDLTHVTLNDRNRSFYAT